ncbi:MAG: AAA family ATPase, partial [Terricaulis sp.]
DLPFLFPSPYSLIPKMTRIIAITGGSGAGKSTLARALAWRLNAPVIAEDDYYRCRTSYLRFDAATHNFDAPDAKEHDLLCEHLSLARAGVAFEKPLYDLSTHRRLETTQRVDPGASMIVEGLHLLATPALRALFDLKVFIDADEALRLERRMLRDIELRDRSAQSVLAQFFENVRPMHELHVEPQRNFADLVLLSPPDASKARVEADSERIARLLTALA